ncbi:hypothetical protein [Pseudoroseicyclus sp. CXY001]|uniref:hypothetical protein n=1 Tax=Pseudoroseicyclus sp. CXY001 TaxID=3242492 RepID=UPI003571447E
MARSTKSRSDKTNAGTEPESPDSPDISPKENPVRPPEPDEAPPATPEEAPDLDPDTLPETPPEDPADPGAPPELPGTPGPGQEAPETPAELPPGPSELPGPGAIPGGPDEAPDEAPTELPEPPDETGALAVAERAALADWGRVPPEEVIDGAEETGAEPDPAPADETPAPPAAMAAGSVAASQVRPEPEPATEPRAAREPAPAPTPDPAPAPRRGGFVPLVLGGALAAGLGYGAHWALTGPMAPPAGDDPERAALEERLAALEADMAALPAAADAPDLAPLQAASDEAGARLDGIETELSEGLDALEARIAALETAPAGGTGTGDAGIVSDDLQEELDSLRAELTAQAERFGALADDAEARIAAAESEAAALQAEAEGRAARAAAIAALSRLEAALQSGTPFEAALAEVQATYPGEIPQALVTAAPDGVPTLAALRSSYPAAARAALATAREEGLSGEEGGRVTNFFRSQLSIRSTAPRDGETPDAILSRAEAALSDGRLNDALAELGALPEVVRAEMTDWLAAAELRSRALAGAETLAAGIGGSAGEAAPEAAPETAPAPEDDSAADPGDGSDGSPTGEGE